MNPIIFIDCGRIAEEYMLDLANRLLNNFNLISYLTDQSPIMCYYDSHLLSNLIVDGMQKEVSVHSNNFTDRFTVVILSKEHFVYPYYDMIILINIYTVRKPAG